MNTEDLIDALAANLEPVRPLFPPALQLLGWLAASVPAIGGVVALEGLREDLPAKLVDPVFLTEQIAAVATALAAAWAALTACVPGTARWARWLPAVPLTFWMASLARQCWFEWIHAGTSGMVLRPDWMCVPDIALTSALPAFAMVISIRRGARLSSEPMLWGSLAAAALSNAALRLFHAQDAALMVIVWQFGSVTLFTMVLAALRRFLVAERKIVVP
ncbi:DUF1109 domain-containing protein [bacterium]|nr:MAG: DUF1109 domain-containing protein [bacterium]